MTTATLETTTIGVEQDVIVTAGAISASTGKRLYGVFGCEADARSEHADRLAIAILAADQLTAEQIAMAERNSEAL